MVSRISTPSGLAWCFAPIPHFCLAGLLTGASLMGRLYSFLWTPAAVLAIGAIRALLWRRFILANHLSLSRNGEDGEVIVTSHGQVRRFSITELSLVAWVPMAGPRLWSQLARDGSVTLQTSEGEVLKIPLRFPSWVSQRKAEQFWSSLLKSPDGYREPR